MSQVSGLAAPLAYVMTLSSAVAAYHVLAEVRPGLRRTSASLASLSPGGIRGARASPGAHA